MKRPEIEMVKIDSLIPWPGNPRIHGEDVAAIVKSIKEFGWTNPVLAQRGTNRVLAGHGRLLAARKAGITEVPVVYLEMDDQKSSAYTIADNKLAEGSSWDAQALKDIFVELDDGAFDIELTGFTKNEVKMFFDGGDPEQQGDDEKPEPKPVVCPKCKNRFVPKKK